MPTDTACSMIDAPESVNSISHQKWLDYKCMSGNKAADGTILYFIRRIKNLRIDPNDDSVARVGNDLETDSPRYNRNDSNALNYSIAEQWPLPMGVSTKFPTNIKTRIKYLRSGQPRCHYNNQIFQLLYRCSRGELSHVRNDWFKWCWNFENRCVHRYLFDY
jgi:hypothetical protein